MSRFPWRIPIRLVVKAALLRSGFEELLASLVYRLLLGLWLLAAPELIASGLFLDRSLDTLRDFERDLPAI